MVWRYGKFGCSEFIHTRLAGHRWAMRGIGQAQPAQCKHVWFYISKAEYMLLIPWTWDTHRPLTIVLKPQHKGKGVVKEGKGGCGEKRQAHLKSGKKCQKEWRSVGLPRLGWAASSATGKSASVLCHTVVCATPVQMYVWCLSVRLLENAFELIFLKPNFLRMNLFNSFDVLQILKVIPSPSLNKTHHI